MTECFKMAGSSIRFIFLNSFSVALTARIFTMFALIQIVSALSFSSLFVQSGASPFLNSRLEPQYEPGHRGAVASESSICSQIGIDLLSQGGNAADAVSKVVPDSTPF